MRLEVINQDPHLVAGKTVMGNEIPSRLCQVVWHRYKYWPKKRLAVLRSCLNDPPPSREAQRSQVCVTFT